MAETSEPRMLTVAQGDLSHCKELSRFLAARGIRSELQRPPERPGAGKS